ncbi:hypothetical protein QJS10_CPA16g00745 [Acorus calamus]|uniref:FHA domain-containing protein n=1 Tax=Acorus calamus TaxID=4465 RepID=A0AAV9D2X8_ACOCL|nr:hypothetical protein QJS10_CPA16g00745 [Acorus calamus]
METTKSNKRQRLVSGSGFFHLRSIVPSDASDPSLRLIRLRSDRLYTFGRKRKSCDVVFDDRRVSRRHCQVFLDGSDRRLLVMDGSDVTSCSEPDEICKRFREGSRVRVSLNGVFVNGRRLQRGAVAELSVGDEVSLACRGLNCDYGVKIGFVVERVVFLEDVSVKQLIASKVFVSKVDWISNYLNGLRLVENKELVVKVSMLLGECRNILNSEDPVSYILGRVGSINANGVVVPEKKSKRSLIEQRNKEFSSEMRTIENNTDCDLRSNEDVGVRLPSDGRTFFLNCLEYVNGESTNHHRVVSLPELFYPTEGLLRVFIATFTSDVSCYPQFPEEIAFGKTGKNRREGSIRVIVTSANLVSKQWNSVTNTVWWQDFPRRNAPDYSELFTHISDCDTIDGSKSDFAAQLAGFMATLIVDVPSQAHWIVELSKYDFQGASGYLVASVPGIHVQNSLYPLQAEHFLSATQIVGSQPDSVKFLGSVQASLVGLSYLFRSNADSNGAQLKTLARCLGKCQLNSYGMSEVILKRNTNIPADVNAVSVHVVDPDSVSRGGSSSIGTSVGPQFLAAFAAAAGKRSFLYSESEESDPEWGRWNAHNELRCPSMRILFPTIQRVKNGMYGIHPSRCLLCFSEKTWQRLRSVGILHDAVPHPSYRVGYPMHVKVARRRFQSKTDMSSFGWIYCGSHNFSSAAWGQTTTSGSDINRTSTTGIPNQVLKLHVCNYELGIVFVAPPPDTSNSAKGGISNLDDITLPFVMPAPKYEHDDRPATAQAMREAVAELAMLERENSAAAADAEELIDEEVADDEIDIVETSDYSTEEKEEEKAYAELLWSQVESSDS